jgi:signal transduction histidine kinase
VNSSFRAGRAILDDYDDYERALTARAWGTRGSFDNLDRVCDGRQSLTSGSLACFLSRCEPPAGGYPMPQTSRSSSTLALVQVLLMAVVVAAFVADTVMDIRSRNVIRAKVDEIAWNAMPSVELVAQARGDVHKMGSYLRKYTSAAAGHAPMPPEVLSWLRQDLETSLTHYLDLPVFPGERALHGEMIDARKAFEPTVDATLAAVDARDWTMAQAALTVSQETEDRFDHALERIQAFNAAEGKRLGILVGGLQGGIFVRTVVVDFVLLALAIAAATLAVLWRRSAAALHERTNELDMFAGRVAHDVLSPLTTVGMALGISKERLAGDTSAVGTVDRASRSLERVKGLVSGLLGFARAGASANAGATVEVADPIRSVVEGVQADAAAAQVELTLEPIPQRRVVCAPGVLTSVLQNLVANAIKYMGDVPRRRVTVRVCDAGPMLRVEVDDTGPGVPEKIQKRLFEPFVRGTGATTGAGLGLATVKRLTEAHGGRVGCRSTQASGSVFWFELPLAVGSSKEQPADR